MKKGDKKGKKRKAGKRIPQPAQTPYIDGGRCDKLISELDAITTEMLSLEKQCDEMLGLLHGAHRKSGRNLVHYLALRRRDIRPLQEQLAALGLSSLGRAESHALASISSVTGILRHLSGRSDGRRQPRGTSFDDGRKLLRKHTEALLGPRPAERGVRIMVTMPTEASEDYALIRDLLANGMDCMRINCAHDSSDVWGRMIENLRRAQRETGRRCRILMDLGGPKIRTGPVEPAVPVLKWRPRRDEFGRVLEPARIWLRPEGSEEQPMATADATLSLPAEWLAGVKPGDAIAFADARGAKRSLCVIGTSGSCLWAETDKTCYLTEDVTLHHLHDGKRRRKGDDGCRPGAFTSADSFILLKPGDTLIVTRDIQPGTRTRYDGNGKLLAPAAIGCSHPGVFADVRPGERIWLDDGKIGGIIKAVNINQIKVKITNARPEGEKLRGEKGINLPDTCLSVSALSEQDVADLTFVARHADMVGMSFAQDTADIAKLRSVLDDLKRPELGIVLKIETRRGFEMLPDLLLAAMRCPVVGVMIARGDLAVECGYERLAEVQEEILWLCEAAHLPVIWATQVLENLAKRGVPSRAEVTDAAMSERAECVMLNKGPHIIEAMRALENILKRMEAHQHKKSHMLRQLRWWECPEHHICQHTS